MEKLTRREMLAASAGAAAGLAASGCSQNGEPVVTYATETPAAGGAASPAVAFAAPVALGPDEPLRVGFIGIGGRGNGLLNAFLKIPNQQVVAVCDINQQNLERAAGTVEKAQGKAPETYGKDADDFKRLLDRKDIHGIVTATPCFEHARIMLAAIKAGKHIYGEKPLALTVADADACLAMAEARKDLVVQVGFQWMASPRFQESIERVRDGDIGQLVEGRFFRHNAAKPMIGWFSDRKKSGDWMLEQACHEYNIMNWVAGTTPLKAYGLGWSNLYQDIDPGRNVTDYYAAIIEYPNNFIVHYAHGWISPDGFHSEFAQKAIGTKGAIELGGNIIRRSDGKPIEPLKAPKGDDTAFALNAWVDSIRQGKPSVAPVAYGRNASLLALMVRKAVYERREVTWKEMLKTC